MNVSINDIKEIGGDLIKGSKGNQTNKIRKGVNKTKGRTRRSIL